MKLQFAIVIGVILVGSIATVNMAFNPELDVSANSVKSTATMLGHVTLTAVNEDGNIIAYRQTDNTVINSGDDCIAEDIFGVATACASTTANFDDIHIGTSSLTFNEASSFINGWHAVTGPTSVVLTSAANGVSGASVTVTASFDNVNANIGEAALTNNPLSASADTLALQRFAGINLGATDDLTIEWTVTIDGN